MDLDQRNKSIVPHFRGSDKKWPPQATAEQCNDIPLVERFDCHPEKGANPSSCVERGCCWRDISESDLPPKQNFHSEKLYRPTRANETDVPLNLPYCYYPRGFSIYTFREMKQNRYTNDITGSLEQKYRTPFPNDISRLKFEVRFETCDRLRVRISDAKNDRFEPPLPLIFKDRMGCTKGYHLYSIDFVKELGRFYVRRKSSGAIIFDTRDAAPLIFSDQFIQLSTSIPTPYIYGLGQHLEGLLIDVYWKHRVLWNADSHPEPDRNLYGSHPFYLALEDGGDAHGVFLLNSNAIDVVLQPTPAVTFRALGGILDLYIFLGPTPSEVVSQYTELVGRPFKPPYWSLGYHQCRYDYLTLNKTREVWQRTRDAGIPFDVQWNDIDYMIDQNDFTYDKVRYKGLPEFIDEVHAAGMHYIVIVDPGISAGEKPGTYPPFDIGNQMGIFVKNDSGQNFIGKVWNPVATVYPDFSLPRATLYWTEMIQKFHREVSFDGLWIDMNEPANFYNGEYEIGCPNTTLENPYFIPPLIFEKLYFRTMCMSTKQYIGKHYDTHNLYSFLEAVATRAALKVTNPDIEPFIISRATYAGMGYYSGHWSGDIRTNWYNMWKSIGSVLTMNLLGVPMIGADICGFGGNTTVSLCNRWMQLGAFYPFSRNHNDDRSIDQDPVAMGPLVVNSSRKALTERYRMLPYLYSLFLKSHLEGTPVATPMFVNYPKDVETYAIDTQFMWGNSLLVVPVLEKGATSVVAYLPKGIWYDWYTGKLVSENGGEYVSLDAPLDYIPLLQKGGSVINCQDPGSTTTESLKNPTGWVISLDSYGKASGEIYYHEQDSIKRLELEFTVGHNRILARSSTSEKIGKVPDWITIYGLDTYLPINSLWMSFTKVNFHYNPVDKVLKIFDIKDKNPFSYFMFVMWT